MRQMGKPQQAYYYYEESISIYRDLDKQAPNLYAPDLATALSNLALLYAQEQQFEEAKKAYNEAKKLRKALALNQPEVYELEYAQILIIGNLIVGTDTQNLQIVQDIIHKYPDSLRQKNSPLPL